MLPDKAIEEFIKIYKKTTGKTLGKKEAVVIAQRVFDGLGLLLQKDSIDRPSDKCNHG